MIRWEIGLVTGILADEGDRQEIEVQIEGSLEKAFNYPELLGRVETGDRVALNTSAVRRNLGTGGYHFVAWIEGKVPATDLKGHIMKLRYTPCQMVCPVVEAPESPHHGTMIDRRSLEGMPVVAAPLHSHVGPVMAGIKAVSPSICTCYVMSDGGALPMALSKDVRTLRREGLIDLTVTSGNAFGGDLEAVTLHSGLLAARWIGGADVAVVAIGPGVVGTGTVMGTTALSQAEALNAAVALEAVPLAVPRIGFGDGRERHRGVSHHTLTVLGQVFLGRCLVVLPLEAKDTSIPRLLWEEGIARRHRVLFGDGQGAMDLLEALNIEVSSMGRRFPDDPLFFLAAGAAGRWAARLVKKEV